jgi:hypothetical protein
MVMVDGAATFKLARVQTIVVEPEQLQPAPAALLKTYPAGSTSVTLTVVLMTSGPLLLTVSV